MHCLLFRKEWFEFIVFIYVLPARKLLFTCFYTTFSGGLTAIAVILWLNMYLFGYGLCDIKLTSFNVSVKANERKNLTFLETRLGLVFLFNGNVGF